MMFIISPGGMFYKPIVLIAIVGLLVGSSILFADDQCYTCGSTAKTVQDYGDMVTKILGSLQTQGGEVSDLGRYTVPGLFGGGILQLEQEQGNAIERSTEVIQRNISQKMQASMALTTILFNNARDIGYNNSIGLAILLKDPAILRDWTKTQKWGSLMQEKIYELALGAAWQDYVTLSDKAQIQGIFNTYKEIGLLDDAQVGNTTTYANLLFLLQTINKNMERFLVFGSIDNFSQTFVAGEAYLKFNMQSIDSMQDAYSCVRGGHYCGGSIQQFLSDIDTITSQNVESAQSALTQFTQAGKRLYQALSSVGTQTQNLFRKKESGHIAQDEEFLSDQDKLLRIVYGSDFKRMQNGILSNIPFRVGGSKAIPTIQTQDTKEKFIANQNNTKSDNNRVNLPVVVKNLLSDTMYDAHQQTQDAIQAATIADPNEITIFIPLIAAQLQTIRDIIGTKDTQGMLVYNLGVACELQCTNAGGTCWW